MPPKRKSEVIDADAIDLAGSDQENEAVDAPAEKKARVSEAGEASTSKGKGKKAAEPAQPLEWQDVVLADDGEDGVPVYDDCNDIRRKIRELQTTPDWKQTYWLKEIGKINSNSYGRFMKASGPTGGASNGTYYAAYVYFEKIRIASGKKKTAKRVKTEKENPHGFPLREPRGIWVQGR